MHVLCRQSILTPTMSSRKLPKLTLPKITPMDPVKVAGEARILSAGALM